MELIKWNFAQLFILVLVFCSSPAWAVDTDGDGYEDFEDAFPNDIEEWLDTDGDGIGNNADPDVDGDGMPNHIGPGGHDVLWDFENGQLGPFTNFNLESASPISGNYSIKTQSPALSFFEVDVSVNSTVTFVNKKIFGTQTNTIEVNNQGVVASEAVMETGGDILVIILIRPGVTRITVHQAYAGSGFYNNQTIDNVAIFYARQDDDDDNDGTLDVNDALPRDPSEQLDSDGDGIGNNRDIDDDNDTILDINDNCPLADNLDQLDFDGDTQGDVCDSDIDNDGVLNDLDFHPYDASRSQVDTNILYTFNGYGSSVSGAGDVNNDGYADVIVGKSDYLSGYARVYSGIDGRIIYSFFDNQEYFGASVSGAGDVNGDGYDDVIISGASSPRVYSGLDGSVLHSFSSFGKPVSGAGDVNGDGYDDLILASSGTVQIYSGVNGDLLHVFSDALSVNSVGDAGDVNGDGYDDVVVGMNWSDAIGQAAKVFSGLDGSVLYAFSGGGGQNYRFTVSGVGDINRDGYDDVIVSGNDQNTTTVSPATVYSGIDGAVLYEFQSQEDDYSAVSGAGDINADGYPDILVGYEYYKMPLTSYKTGSVEVFSGLDGSLLYFFVGDKNYDYFGRALSGAGDVNGDGYSDIIVVDNNEYARVFSGKGLWNDNDGDGQNDAIDDDDDNDGVLDINDFAPLDASESIDTDNDRVGDNLDNCVNDFNPEQLDTDGDSQGDVCDNDDDNDGVLDGNDVCPLDPSASNIDTDFDGLCNENDLDDDNDSVLDVNDAFPLDAAEQYDTDNDGIGNNADNDDDNDGYLDAEDAFPLDSEEWLDTDGDSIGNNADPDVDGDGMPNLLGPGGHDVLYDFEGGDMGGLISSFAVISGSNVIAGNYSAEFLSSTEREGGYFQVSAPVPSTLFLAIYDLHLYDIKRNNLSVEFNTYPNPMSQVSIYGILIPAGITEVRFDTGPCSFSIGCYPIRIDNVSIFYARQDDDDDNDGTLDVDDDFPRDPSEQSDTDGDGIGNNRDWDDDNDGVPDTVDAEPLNPLNKSEINLPLSGSYKGSVLKSSAVHQ